MSLFKYAFISMMSIFTYSVAIAGPNSCNLTPAEIKNFQKLNGKMFTVQSSAVWEKQVPVVLYMEDLSKPLAQPVVINKRNRISMNYSFASRLLNNLSEAPGFMRFDKMTAGNYRISVVYYDSCKQPVKQVVLSSQISFSGMAIAENIPPVIQNISVQSFAGYPYIQLNVADLESGIDRVELWADGQFSAIIHPEGRHGTDLLKPSTDQTLYRIYSLSGGLFDYRITPSFNMSGKNVQIKAFDVHGNMSVAQVPAQ